MRRTALLIHLQKRVLRAPAPEVLAGERYWILPNGFTVQDRVTPWSVRAARSRGATSCPCIYAGCNGGAGAERPAVLPPTGEPPCRSSGSARKRRPGRWRLVAAVAVVACPAVRTTASAPSRARGQSDGAADAGVRPGDHPLANR